MTGASLSSSVLRRRLSLREKLLVREDTGALALGDATRLAKHVALTMFAFEGTAAVVLFARFVGEEPIERAAWSAVFHSVSAFNNAGFDVMGGFHSLTAYRSDPVVLLTMAALIDRWTQLFTLADAPGGVPSLASCWTARS